MKADQPVGATMVQVPVINPCGWPLYVRTAPVGSFPPDVPDPTNDWTLDISPELQLPAPGEESTVLMELTSPRAAVPGAVIDIPLAFYGTQSAFPDLGPEFPTELMETIMLNSTVVEESAVSCIV